MKTGRPRARPLRNQSPAPASFYVPPPVLPPRPDWLRLGARFLFLQPMSDRCAIGTTLWIIAIRPTPDGQSWEVLSHQTANRWFRLTEIAPLDREDL